MLTNQFQMSYANSLWFSCAIAAIFLFCAGLIALSRRHPDLFKLSPKWLAQTLSLLSKFWFGDMFCVRVIFGSISATVGLFVMMPFSTNTPPFTILSTSLPEWSWGLMFFLQGFCQIVSAYLPDKSRFSEITSLIGVFTWSYLFQLTIRTQPNSIAVALYAMLIMVWMLIWWNLPDNTIAEAIDALADKVAKHLPRHSDRTV